MIKEVFRLSSHSIDSLDVEDVSLNESETLENLRKQISQHIEDNYGIYLSNVDHLDEAQIICLGEIHGCEMHQRINAQIIDMLYEEETILLVESGRDENCGKSDLLEENESINEQSKFVTQPIKIQGWDIELDENHLKDLKKFVRASIIYEEPKTVHFLSASKVDDLKDNLENNRWSTCTAITKLFSYCCTLFCTSCFVKSCKPCIKKYYENDVKEGLQKIIDGVPLRNQRMCESIQTALESCDYSLA